MSSVHPPFPWKKWFENDGSFTEQKQIYPRDWHSGTGTCTRDAEYLRAL